MASFNHDGYGTNVVNGKDNYNKNVMAGRVSVELTPISPLFIRFAADHTTDNSLPRQGYRLLPGIPGGEKGVGPRLARPGGVSGIDGGRPCRLVELREDELGLEEVFLRVTRGETQ